MRLIKHGYDYGKQYFEEAQFYHSIGNYGKCADLLKKAAAQGYPAAQFNLSTSYNKADPAKAFYWCKKAAEQGHFKAQVNLTYYYALGIGVIRDMKEAIRWAKISSKIGDNIAFNNILIALENLEKENTEEAFQFYLELAEYGICGAQKRVAEFYYEGNVVSKDENKANYWMKKAIEKGDENLLHNIAFAYEKGIGIGQSYEEAFSIYERLAKKGFAPSQSSLGCFYNEGWSVVRNLQKAVYWWKKAVEQGDASAQCNLGFFYQNGTYVEQNYEKAFELYHKSMAQGFANAYYNLGCCYYRGLGVKEDDKEASRLFLIAAGKGHLNAQFNIALNYEGGYGVKKDIKQAIFWYTQAAEQGDQEAAQRCANLKNIKVESTTENHNPNEDYKSILASLHNEGTEV